MEILAILLIILLGIALVGWLGSGSQSDVGARRGRKTRKPENPWDAHEYIGQITRSDNGRFTLVTQDSDFWSGGRRGGHRSDGPGRVTIFDGKSIRWQKKLERPNDGAVSNDGHVAVNDWLFSDALSGVLYLFDADGETLVKQSTQANLQGCGLDDEGRVAWYETANAPHEDGNQLFVYDFTGEALLRMDRPGQGIQSVRYRNGEFNIDFGSGVHCQVGSDGSVLNPAELARARARRLADRGNPLAAAERWLETEPIEELSSEARDELLRILDRAKGDERSERRQARAMRLKGEIQLESGEKKKALESFEEALSLDPKVGVKRVAKRLRKEIEAS